MEFLFELVAEVLLQIVLEVLAEFGIRGLTEPFRSEHSRNPFLAMIGYTVFGAAVGGVSLLIFPKLFLSTAWLRNINLIVSPFASGLTMMLIGAWRQQRHQELIRLDRFLYGALFALGMALVRFWGGQ